MRAARAATAAALSDEALDALHRMIDNVEHDRLIRKNRLFMHTCVDNDA